MTKSSSKMTYVKYKIECLSCVFSNKTMILKHSFLLKIRSFGAKCKNIIVYPTPNL